MTGCKRLSSKNPHIVAGGGAPEAYVAMNLKAMGNAFAWQRTTWLSKMREGSIRQIQNLEPVQRMGFKPCKMSHLLSQDR